MHGSLPASAASKIFSNYPSLGFFSSKKPNSRLSIRLRVHAHHKHIPAAPHHITVIHPVGAIDDKGFWQEVRVRTAYVAVVIVGA